MDDALRSSSSADPAIERLADAVERLTDHVRVLTDLVEATRDELQWITRNGMPHQTLTVRVVPAVEGERPVAWAETEKTEPLSTERPVTVQELDLACEWLGEHITELLQEQLHLIVSAVQREPAAATPSTSRHAKATVPQAGSTTSPTPVSTAPHSNRPAQSLLQFDDELAEIRGPENHPTPSTAGEFVTPVTPSTLPPVILWNVGDAVEFTVRGREAWGEIVAVEDATNTATVQLIPSEEEVVVCLDDLRTERATARQGDLDPLRHDESATVVNAGTDSVRPTALENVPRHHPENSSIPGR